ncbi:hypothetical protein [Vibrio vulnificus]|uniref:hypothetical protein n=1 Tax=Vibrio vulnificus TaxID=672 RepID=UPI003ED9D44A
MKNLSQLKVNNIIKEDWLTKATSSKKSNVAELKVIENELKIAYANYDTLVINHKNELNDSEFLTSSNVLKDFYNYPPTSLKKLIKERRNDHGLNECPFCGKPVSPSTLDHYIPKNNWPEFSIFQNNLVPQCKECAPIKGDSYYCYKKGISMFISPIYSDILSKVDFHIDVDYSKDDNSISVNPRFSLSNDVKKDEEYRLISHFENLKIKQRIITYSHRRIRHWKNLLKESEFDIHNTLKTRINERKIDEQTKNWETSLYIGILKNNELVKYLNSLCPKNKNNIIDPPVKRREMII